MPKWGCVVAPVPPPDGLCPTCWTRIQSGWLLSRLWSFSSRRLSARMSS